jgi:integrase
MGRSRKDAPLAPIDVQRLVEPGFHFVGEVTGLALSVAASGARSWVLRATVGGKRRDIGLGGFPSVTLASARKAARDARETIHKGVDPIEAGKAARSATKAARAAARTFDQCAAAFIAAKEPGWSNSKHAEQWRATLATYATPHMGELLVRDVATAHVMAALEPIWATKTETATRVRGRIEAVLDWATTREFRTGPNPARWRGHLEQLLPRARKVTPVVHHAAVPVRDAGAFMAKLRAAPGVSARCLEFVMLTAARSGEARAAEWSELDLDAAVWTVPATKMKAKRQHRTLHAAIREAVTAWALA